MSYRFSCALLLLALFIAGVPAGMLYAVATVPGGVVKVFDYGVTEFVLHPTLPVLYANDYRNQSIVAIDTEKHSVIDTFHVGTLPTGLVLSPDGARLYAGVYTGLSIIDIATHEVTAIPLDFKPGTIAYGYDDRLWITSEQLSSIAQLDAFSGMRSGDSASGGSYGMLQTSLDRRLLYFAEKKSGNVKFQQFDITEPTAQLVWQNAYGAMGSGAKDLVLSHDGSMLAVVATGGNRQPNRYDVAFFDAINKEVLGVVEPGYYPQQLAFSPDDALAYVVHTDQDIDVFSTTTFEHIDTWRFAGPYDGDTIDVITDRTGKYLFAAKPDYIAVLETGRIIIPEPATVVIALIGAFSTTPHRLRNPRVFRGKRA